MPAKIGNSGSLRRLQGQQLLDHVIGYLQTDDYALYHRHKARYGVIGVACWHMKEGVSSKRTIMFEKALEHDGARASVAMKLIQKLYDVEREARNMQLSDKDRKGLRLQRPTSFMGVSRSTTTHENAIQPIAIGRKNQLFAGHTMALKPSPCTDPSSVRATSMVSFFIIGYATRRRISTPRHHPCITRRCRSISANSACDVG